MSLFTIFSQFAQETLNLLYNIQLYYLDYFHFYKQYTINYYVFIYIKIGNSQDMLFVKCTEWFIKYVSRSL